MATGRYQRLDRLEQSGVVRDVDPERQVMHGERASKRLNTSASRNWIIALHLAACRRWLCTSPPRIEEAGATFQLLHEFASSIDEVRRTGGLIGAPYPCPLMSVQHDAELQKMLRLLELLEAKRNRTR